jgi:putative transposase
MVGFNLNLYALYINIFIPDTKKSSKITMNYTKSTHAMFSLQYHLILTVKYRKPLLVQYGTDVKNKILEVAKTSRFTVLEINDDRDHLHILVAAQPNISPSQIVKSIKGQTTQDLWTRYPQQLRQQFWKKKINHVFWSPSYFICSVGHVDQSTIENYIKKQGNNTLSIRGASSRGLPRED